MGGKNTVFMLCFQGLKLMVGECGFKDRKTRSLDTFAKTSCQANLDLDSRRATRLGCRDIFADQTGKLMLAGCKRWSGITGERHQ